MTSALPRLILLVILYFGKLEAARFLDEKCHPGFVPMMINGKNAYRSPWMAFLIYNGEYICSGSLVNSRDNEMFINIYRSNKVNIIDYSYARLGEYDTSTTTDGQTYDISVTAVFPEPWGQDIALLKLAQTITQYTETIRPICIVISGNLNEVMQFHSVNSFTVTGWGQMSRTNKIQATVLQEISVTKMDSAYCGNPKGQICCQNPSQFVCHGDSGSPLFSTGRYNYITSSVLYGVLSSGHEKCYDYAKYVDIIPYTSWICNTIRSNL
ncbi:hypothetical protein KR200_000331 [Drosophila serrata]|nr:hypothetical protein KR200_000331 [Drosophila serrata]